MKHFDIDAYRKIIRDTDPFEYGGKVSQIIGLTVESIYWLQCEDGRHLQDLYGL